MKRPRSSSRPDKRARQRVKKLRSVERITQDGSLPAIPSAIVGLTPQHPAYTYRAEVGGVRLPADIYSVIDSYREQILPRVREKFNTPPWKWNPEEWTQSERDEWRPMGTDIDWDNLGSHLGEAFRQGFFLALLRYGEQLQHVSEAVQILNDQQEGGELLAEEGRRAKAESDAERHSMICQLWKKVRPGFPLGRTGNGDALRAVVDRYAAKSGNSIQTRAVRNILKKAGIIISK